MLHSVRVNCPLALFELPVLECSPKIGNCRTIKSVDDVVFVDALDTMDKFQNHIVLCKKREHLVESIMWIILY